MSCKLFTNDCSMSVLHQDMITLKEAISINFQGLFSSFFLTFKSIGPIERKPCLFYPGLTSDIHHVGPSYSSI